MQDKSKRSNSAEIIESAGGMNHPRSLSHCVRKTGDCNEQKQIVDRAMFPKKTHSILGAYPDMEVQARKVCSLVPARFRQPI